MFLVWFKYLQLIDFSRESLDSRQSCVPKIYITVSASKISLLSSIANYKPTSYESINRFFINTDTINIQYICSRKIKRDMRDAFTIMGRGGGGLL